MRLFPRFNGDFLVHSYICGKIFMKILLVLERYEPNCEQRPSRNVEEKTPGSKSRGRWPPKFKQIFTVHIYSCSEIFTKISPVDFM